MNFEQFQKNVYDVGLKEHHSREQIQVLLAYARPLIDKKLPVIVSPEHFSELVGYLPEYVYAMSRDASFFYRSFQIPKKSGGTRKIDEPLPDLKSIQSWILSNILSSCSVSKYAKAYIKGKNVKDNARFHRGKKYVINLDITDFFPSIHIWQINQIFTQLGYASDVSLFFAHLCTLNNCLPQGAPTSPYLSNLFFRDLDEQIALYSKNNGWRYTRYADDMSFSGSGDIRELIKTISTFVYNYGLLLNSKKTRVLGRGARQQITGIVVNEKMQVNRNIRRDIRQKMFYITKFGLESHISHEQIRTTYYIESLLGKIQYCLFINPQDSEMANYQRQIIEIMESLSA